MNEELWNAVDAANIGFARLDANGRFEAMNPAFAAALGQTEERLLRQDWRLSVHPEDHDRVTEAYRTAQSGVPGYAEIRGQCADGSTIYQAVTITSRRDSAGGVIGFHLLRQDVSAYKAEQQALTLAVESAPSGLLMVSRAGKIVMANAAVERIFGYPRHELIGQPMEILMPERLRSRHCEHREEFQSSGRVKAGRDLVGRRKDGAEVPIQVYLNVIDAPGGGLTLCTILDIGERVRYQSQLEEAKRQAESANRAKSDFLARMSHEIRTPMNLIMGMSALLLESSLGGKQREYVEISYRNVKRLLRLINGILDISKIEAGKLTLESAPFDVRELVAEVAATIAAAAEQKGLEFTANVDPGVWPYWVGDRERLQQVLLNLIGNALKFTPAGRIDVIARPTAMGGIQFEVSDTGCGVPKDKAEAIFEPFQQADDAMSRSYEGTGLGLAISKTLVEMMGGTIWVEDAQGSGATFAFTVNLPRCTVESTRCGELKAPGRLAGAVQIRQGTRILVAEDNPENVVLLQAYLSGLPVELDCVPNGARAVEARQSGAYDLVLMDIQMPLMDGYTATRAIRAWEQANGRERVPVVALTAHALLSAELESREAGCDLHLTKPVERDCLIEAISKFAGAQPGAEVETKAWQQCHEVQFLRRRRADVERLQEALVAGDLSVVQAIGHNCKGVAKGYGFAEIGVAGAELENAARIREIVALESAVRNFAAVVEEAYQTGASSDV